MGTSLVKFNRKSNSSVNQTSNKEEEFTSKRFDVVGHLQTELAQKIFFQLSSDDLRSATLCCLSWKAALSSEYIWKKLCDRDGYFEVEESNRSEFYNNFLKRYSYWQGVYWYNQTLQRNWETNNCKEVVYEVHDVHCFSDAKEQWLYEDVFIVRKKNWNKLYVYRLKKKEFKPNVFLVPERNSGCYSPYIWKSGKYLIYFQYEVGLTVWDLENGSMAVDKSWNHITSIRVYKNLFVLLEFIIDKFEVFNIETGEIEYECNGKFMKVDIMEGKIVYVTKDHVIHILKWEDKSLVTFTCCNDTYDRKLLIKKDLLLSFCVRAENIPGTTLCVWNITNKTKLHSIYSENFYDLLDVRFISNYFVFINYNYFRAHGNSAIELWDYKTGTREVTVLTSENKLYLSQARKISNDYAMVVRSSSKTSVWCLKTKNFVWNLKRSWLYELYDVEVTQAKLVYAIALRSNAQRKSISIHVRDYEI